MMRILSQVNCNIVSKSLRMEYKLKMQKLLRIKYNVKLESKTPSHLMGQSKDHAFHRRHYLTIYCILPSNFPIVVYGQNAGNLYFTG